MNEHAAQSADRRKRGRPPKKVENRPEVCPEGHPGRVVLWGRREWTTAPFRRQRARCYPSNGRKAHCFSLDRRQATSAHQHGEDCPTCDLRPGIAQGPIALADHFHTANEIARLLQLLGRGTTLRRASQSVRLEAHRYVEDGSGFRHASRQHALAARYLDLFGARVDEQLAPRRWPRILVLDSKPLNVRAYGAEEHVPGWDPEDRGGAILMAVGTDVPGSRLMPVRIGLAGDETKASWADFLREIDPDGQGPEWVVADGASAIEGAVRDRWPDAIFYSCEFHLGRALAEAAMNDGLYIGVGSEHHDLFDQALWSEENWDRLRRVAFSKGWGEVVRWVATNDAVVRRQARDHKAHFGYPRSNAPAERILDWIDKRFGRRRRYRLRNAKRLRLILALIRAEHAGQADVAAYAALIKREFRSLPLKPRLAWHGLHDREQELSSLATLIVAADARARAAETAYMATAKVRSVLALLEAENQARAQDGLPSLTVAIGGGRKTASVEVKGLMLAADFPRVARDWDAAKNDRAIANVTAGSSYPAHWKCHRCGHTWTAPVNQRTKRLTRCERCVTERADGLNSLAAVHEELRSEWDAEANKPLRFDRIKATYDKAVSWHCADPGHPPYRMSPYRRGKIEIGCRLCRNRSAKSGDTRVAA